MPAATPSVELVEVRTTDDVAHAGAFGVPKRMGGTPRFDAALMMHGAGGAFYEAFFRNFSTALVDRGVATLRANNRGHDIVNRGNGRGTPLGVALERVEDCVLDWDAWLGFLQTRGFRRILLFGHSLGAVKSAYYLATRNDPRVTGCVLASPPRFNTAQMLASDRGLEFQSMIDAADALVAAGTPDALMPTTFPLRSFAGAQAYLAKYASGSRFDVLALAPKIPCPVLALTGENELLDANFCDHPSGFAIAAAEKERHDLDFLVVPNGDHYYTLAQGFAIEHLLAWIDRESLD
jgi:pimeloyl-ACP methyl ester carboxylesterase